MWIVIGTIYLFIGLVIGSAMCIHAGDDPYDRDSMLAIMAIGFVWPVIIVIVLIRILLTFATSVAEVLFTNNTQETEEYDG